MLIEILIFIVFILMYCLLFFNWKKYRLKKHGISITAKVVSVTKTNRLKGDGTFAVPIYEIAFEWEQTPGKLKTVCHAFDAYQELPKPEELITLLVDPKKTDYYCIDDR